jgi:alkaline phosphatase D
MIPRMHNPLEALWRGQTDRRAFLIGGLAVIGAGALSRVQASPRWDASPFTLGVASGDPEHDGVVLWTRLAPDPLNGGGMPRERVEVRWEVAEDEGMQRVVKQGRATAAPDWAHAVHVEVDGLAAQRPYWYRFHAGSATSPIGRTRTLPKPGDEVDLLRFAFASCQHYENGFFTAYRHMAGEDLDLVLHLGDYIYEGPGRDNQARRHVGPELMTLADYRNRYAQYRSDPDLQAAHAAFPWIVTTDDHEVDNNYAGEISEQLNVPRRAFLERRAAAYRAYYEHMPLRRRSVPARRAMRLYRQVDCGRLASFFVLDTRQYRTDQPCGDGLKTPCPEAGDARGTLLGRAQERWLFDGLARSNRRWNVLAQQVMMADVDQTPGPDARYSMDQWPGYTAARTRLLERLASRRTSNPVVLTGDIHTNWVNDLKIDSRDPNAAAVATEFVGTSIASGGDGLDQSPRMKDVLAENPFVKFQNSQRGYVSCAVTASEWRADYHVVDYVSRPGAPQRTRASFKVVDGRAGAERL